MSKEKTAFIPKQYFAVVAVLLAIMMSVLDGTIMNIALPTLAHDFDVTPSNAIWIVNAYQLVITMTLLSFASLGDIYGYRRIFLTGISIFAGASLACALSDSFWMLTVSRIIQGFGAACVMSVNTALIRLIYPPQILGRGMGVNAMVVAVSAAAGPSIAGSILALGSWHWLFVINIPLGLAALVIGHRFLPHNPASDTKHKFDKISAIANALTFGLLIYTLEGFAHAENRKFIAIQLVLLIIIGTYFIRRQLKETTPILPVDTMKAAASELLKFGCGSVLLKGGHLEGNKMCDVLQTAGEDKPHLFISDKIESKNTHGTGCTLSSAIATFLALGYDMPQAVEHAKAYVTKGIHAGKDVHIGEGHGPLNHFYAPVPMKTMK